MITLVIGAPCSGKTTYVREHANRGDIVVDFDILAQALGSPDTHDHPGTVKAVTIAARKAAVAAAIRAHEEHNATVWIITTRLSPERLTRYQQLGAHVVVLDVAKVELHRRAATAGRPQLWHGLIDGWVAPRAEPLRGNNSSVVPASRAW